MSLMATLGLDASGFDKGIEASAGKGEKLQTSFKQVATVGGAALVGLGAAALKFGNDYDEATDTVAVASGKTGDALEDLNASMMTTFKNVPVSMKDAATAIGDLNARLGLTGKPLEDIAAKMLTLSRLTGTDIKTNVADLTRVFGDWSIATGDQSLALDKILKASQLTGVGINKLSAGVVQFGGPMRQLGFSFEETIAILGKFEKEGVNTELVMGSMRIALGKMAKDGEAPVETLNRVMEAIKNAGDAGEANALALEMFGARAGPDMAAAIREGRFAIDDLVAQLADAEGTIAATAASTDDWREKLTLLKNNVIAVIAPYGDMAAAALAGTGTIITMAAQAPAAFHAVSGAVTATKAAVLAMNLSFTASLGVIGGIIAIAGVAYLAYKKLSGGADDASKATDKLTRANEILKTMTVSQIEAARAQAEAELKAAAAHAKSFDEMKKLAGLKASVDAYDEALQQVNTSTEDQARATDGVTSAYEKMNDVVDEGTDLIESAGRAADVTRGQLSDFDFVLAGINTSLDTMTTNAGNAFSALDKFRSVPTQEQLDLNAAIAGNNLALFEAKQRLEEAKKAGDEMATAIATEHVKALEDESSKLADAKTKLDLMRDATIEADKAKLGLTGTVDGLIKSEAELLPTIDTAAASMGGQTGAADLLREAGERLRSKFGDVVGMLTGALRPALHDSTVGVTELKDNFGEFTAGAFIEQAYAAAAAAWEVAVAAETAAANISIMQQLAANPTVIPVVPPGTATGPAQADGAALWEGGGTWVGEHGAEWVNLPYGSEIYSHGQSMAMADRSEPEPRFEVVVNIDGRRYVGDMVRTEIRQTNARQRRAAELAGVM